MLELFSLAGLYTLWVLLPLVPSILIYWLFPSTSVAVSGPLANLTVRAGGAFAAYLVIFLVTYYPIVQHAQDVAGGIQHPFWTITGEVKLLDKDGNEINYEKPLEHMVVYPQSFRRDVYFLRIYIPQTEEVLPSLILKIPEWNSTNAYKLEEPSDLLAIDYAHKTIKITKPIIFTSPTRVTATQGERDERETSAQAR